MSSAADATSSEQEYKTISFRPGPTGLWLSNTGKVLAVSEGQARDAGVEVGWRMVMVKRSPYTPDLVDQHIRGDKSYHAIFSDGEVAEAQRLLKLEVADESWERVVARHSTEQDCWIIINGRVYDLTKYLSSRQHPGGNVAVLDWAGKDASEPFNLIHPPNVLDQLSDDAFVGDVNSAIPRNGFHANGADKRTAAASSYAADIAPASGAAPNEQAKSKTTRSGWFKKLALCCCA